MRGESLTRWFGWLIGVAAFLRCWRRISEARTPVFVWDAPSIAGDVGERATPPRRDDIARRGRPIWDRINIATLGTLIAILLGVPVAFLAARKPTPSAWLVGPVALLVIVSTRSLNALAGRR